jgi:hypothetical protein
MGTSLLDNIEEAATAKRADKSTVEGNKKLNKGGRASRLMGTEPLELTVGRQVLERFRSANAARQAQGDRLRTAIRYIVEANAGGSSLTGPAILAQLPTPAELGRIKAPSLDSVQRHLRAIRAAHVGVQLESERS